MNLKYCCPVCGEVLRQGEYYYDADSDTMRVEHCSNNCESEGEKCVPINDCRPEPEQSEYNDLGFDVRTGTPWNNPEMDYEH